MLRRLLDRFRTLTRRQRVIIIAVVMLLVLVVLTLLLGEAAGAPRLGAAAALVLLALAAFGVLGYFLTWLRFQRSTVAVGAGVEAAASGARPSVALVSGFGPLVGQSARAAELRWLDGLSALPARSILAHGLSTRAGASRDFFALQATGGRFDAAALATLLRASGDSTETALRAVGPCEPNALVALARLLLAQRWTDDDVEVARLLRRLVPHQQGRFSPLSRQSLVQQAIVAGERELAVAMLAPMPAGEYPARFHHIDLLNPHGLGAGTETTEEVWLAAFGGIFRRAGLEPIGLLDSGATVFDRLTAAAPVVSVDGPLVTVIMSCYQPDESLLTAVRSMVGQTWPHWELLIADDASPTDPGPILARAAALDPRVRVLRSTRNGGTYVRRNEALAQARGDLVTMHDSDDWAHPRRLEVQVRHLLENPGLVANLSQSMRVDENLVLTLPRGASLRLTESSLLFWRERVQHLIGGFDTVRKAADSEFRMRLQEAVGEEVPLIDLEAPLSLVRFDTRSLSGGDLRDGWLHPARIAYRGAQLEWRRRKRQQGGPLHLDAPEAERAFPAHGHLTGDGPAVHELDVLYVLDPRDGIAQRGPLEAAAAELARLAAAGLRVGLRRAEALVPERPPVETQSALQSLINDGLVREVLPMDTVSAATLVVRQRTALAGVSPLDQPVRASGVLIVRDGASLPVAFVDRALGLLAPDRTSTRTVDAADWASELDRLSTEYRA